MDTKGRGRKSPNTSTITTCSGEKCRKCNCTKTPPPTKPLWKKPYEWHPTEEEINWQDCYSDYPTSSKLNNSFSFVDWSPYRSAYSNNRTLKWKGNTSYLYVEANHSISWNGGGFVGSQLQHDNWPLQNTQWKLAVALAPIKWYSFNYSSDNSIHTLWGTPNKTVFATACVFDPFVLLSGPIQMHLNVTSHLYEGSCTGCTLYHCINSTFQKDSLMILKQPAFAWVPTNLTEPWESHQTYKLLHDLVKILKRQKIFLGMLIAGIFALVMLLTSVGIATSSMIQSVQTSQFVQKVKENVTKTLSIQKRIDSQFEIELWALKSTVLWMGDKIHSLD
ncbi:PREDICTED: endogenous retrovirus group K member 13-1 Env polyprotein-like [Myotis brandtii]|uniref:endogenous retrovirus group K member 13-1 Env polyprotein-like n=1 Tax=Myotis brandtii TaxID=109478 RepID=UPI0007044AB1|nr:PREDICTED: endogenous retrovirus group K member 13-1 Env polyprotein-like [Myotis brandtii]XP_014394112.1 PREDICTED: endogenous retrovirus group K member 13-1 Env polyprotein-like [Myotis brandtii]